MVDAKTAAKRILQVFSIPLVVLALIGLARCATTSSHNSLGTVSYGANPLMYNAGSVKSIDVIDGNLNLRFLPLGTYAMYDENILLCGKPVKLFEGVTEPFVLVYRRQASHLVRGVGCHELQGVYSLAPKALR
jgi:hypothetical protein